MQAMGELFDIEEAPPSAQAGRASVVGVAVAANVWSTYDYAWPGGMAPAKRGQRVRVPFGGGNRKTLGFVVRAGEPARTDRKLKYVASLLDTEPQLDEPLLQLAEWIAHYYLTPLGMVLGAMVPSAVGQHAQRRESVVYLAEEPESWPKQLGLRQRKVLDELIEARKQGVEPLGLEQVVLHSGGQRDTIRRLISRGLIRTESRAVVLADLLEATEADPFGLNAPQQAAVEAINATLGEGFTPLLLHGVTGSGKTEVYIRAIRQAVENGGQAILLAPEIALATQTLERLVRRLPRVAVLHSGLTSAQRAFHYEQIRDGHAAVVIGPRSAVFAPTRNLKLIIVDEEHEGSYKQDNTPRYNARDVAIKRAHLAGVPVVLGSATPSLETWANVQSGKYRRLELAERVKSLPMPKLQLVHLRQDLERGRVELIGRTMGSRIADALDRSQQVILLMNRRGYASYVFCPSCQWTMQCDDCDRPLVFHQATQLALCHYCSQSAALPEYCPACGKKILLFGMGIQRIEDELARKFPLARTARMDSDTMTSAAQFTKLLDDFRGGEIDILLGTQMVAKGLDFPRVSLVGVVSADTSLAIPDFRSAERTFQLIVQVAGRAGRAEGGGQVIVQTLHADEPAIQRAVAHDYEGFASDELPLREQLRLPPYSRMVRLILRHNNSEKCEQGAAQLAERVHKLFPPASGVRITGPAIAAIARIRKQYRWDLLLTSQTPGLVQNHLGPVMDRLTRDIPGELLTDVDPLSLA